MERCFSSKQKLRNERALEIDQQGILCLGKWQ